MFFKTDASVMPELVTGKDKSRPVFQIVHLDIEHSEVRATDSYMAARFPVQLDEGDTDGPIPVEALKSSRKSPFSFLKKTSIRANSHVEVVAGTGEDASAPYVTLPRETSAYQYPDLDRLWPGEGDLNAFRVAIDATKLIALAKAIGAAGKNQGVVLQFFNSPNGDPSALRSILVTPLGGDDDSPSAILMPIRLT